MIYRILGRLFSILCIAFVFSACMTAHVKPKVAKSETTTQFILHMDSQFEKNDYETILRSFKKWELDSHGVVKFVVSSTVWNSSKTDMEFINEDDQGCTTDVYVATVNGKHPIVRNLEKGHEGNTLGFTHRGCEEKIVGFVMNRIKNSDVPNALSFVATHEAGHLVGLAHIPVPGQSIMFPSMDLAANCTSKLDMMQFCLIYGCDWKDMNYCEPKELPLQKL